MCGDSEAEALIAVMAVTAHRDSELDAGSTVVSTTMTIVSPLVTSPMPVTRLMEALPVAGIRAVVSTVMVVTASVRATVAGDSLRVVVLHDDSLDMVCADGARSEEHENRSQSDEVVAEMLCDVVHLFILRSGCRFQIL